MTIIINGDLLGCIIYVFFGVMFNCLALVFILVRPRNPWAAGFISLFGIFMIYLGLNIIFDWVRLS